MITRIIHRTLIGLPLLLATQLVLAGTASQTSDIGIPLPQKKCISLQQVYNKMSAKMPMKMDSITHMYSASAHYDRDSQQCNVDLQYLVSEEGMIENMQNISGGNLNYAESLSFIRSEKGQSLLNDVLKKQLEKKYRPFHVSGVNIVAHYNTIGQRLGDMEVRLFR